MRDRVESLLRLLLGTRHDWRVRRPTVPALPQLGVHTLGPVLAIVTLCIGWFAFTNAVGDGNTSFALFIGSVSILMMAWSNLLSTRASSLEKVFGGLDRMYRWHRWFGALSVGAMWLHMEIVDDVKGIRGASKSIADAAEDLAETGSTLLYILVAASVLRWIPSRWWRLSHKALILPYMFACWHFYTATKPYANNSPWGWWFTTFMIIGIGAWVYRVMWRDMVRKGEPHRVANLQHSGNSLTVELEPLGTPLQYTAGQFAFLKIERRGLREPHPFTIASHPSENVLRFVIKDLGDWTQRVGQKLRVSDRVTVEGPYGKLPLFPSHNADEIIWIAGGVGITPFLGAATKLSSRNTPRPHLFYCVRSRDDAPGLDELEEAHRHGRIHLHLHSSSEGNRLQSEDISAISRGGDLSHAHVVMCGPTPLITRMRSTVRSMGVRHVHIEAFDIRTGVGPDLSREVDSLTSTATIRDIAQKLSRTIPSD